MMYTSQSYDWFCGPGSQITNNVRFLLLSSESITSSPSARRWTPSASAASGRTRQWSTSSSTSTSTSSPTAAWSTWCSSTRRTTRSCSSSLSLSSSRWPWWCWWSGAASGATFWPSVWWRKRSDGQKQPPDLTKEQSVCWTPSDLLQISSRSYSRAECLLNSAELLQISSRSPPDLTEEQSVC